LLQKPRGAVQGPDTEGTTAVIAVEAARRLVRDGAKTGRAHTAQAYDPTGFLNFLAPHGISLAIPASDTQQ
jgi:hypothetical protein